MRGRLRSPADANPMYRIDAKDGAIPVLHVLVAPSVGMASSLPSKAAIEASRRIAPGIINSRRKWPQSEIEDVSQTGFQSA